MMVMLLVEEEDVVGGRGEELIGKRVNVTTNHGRHRIIQSVFSEAFVAAPSNPSCSSCGDTADALVPTIIDDAALEQVCFASPTGREDEL
mmetsp:Transcript_13640/g.17330  ORF Transcript_13640/g.17330 Transcript_13640/m.17330 type:complete len:90 (+) Transcript_13640:201-470(+)